MQVEVFALDEMADMGADERECARALINKLGLEKQKSYISGDKAVQPFRQITHEERFALKLLCPKTTKLPDYDSGPIPLRVLEVAERAVETGFFKELVVWHPEDVRLDPVLIGLRRTDPKYEWILTEYLLARWGEALDEMPALMRKALDTAKAKVRALQAEITMAISLIEAGDVASLSAAFEPRLSGITK